MSQALMQYLFYMNGRIMQIIGFPNIIELFMCHKVFFYSETFIKSRDRRCGLALGYTTYVTAISTMWSVIILFLNVTYVIIRLFNYMECVGLDFK
jgi:hypothetical protein